MSHNLVLAESIRPFMLPETSRQMTTSIALPAAGFSGAGAAVTGTAPMAASSRSTMTPNRTGKVLRMSVSYSKNARPSGPPLNDLLLLCRREHNVERAGLVSDVIRLLLADLDDERFLDEAVGLVVRIAL